MLIRGGTNLGCFVALMFGLHTDLHSEVGEPKLNNNFIKRAKESLEDVGSGVVVWSDNQYGNGNKIFQFLKSKGYQVGRSQETFNPGSGNKCRIYWWNHVVPARKVSARSVSSGRGVKVKKKAKAPRRRSTG